MAIGAPNFTFKAGFVVYLQQSSIILIEHLKYYVDFVTCVTVAAVLYHINLYITYTYLLLCHFKFILRKQISNNCVFPNKIVSPCC